MFNYQLLSRLFGDIFRINFTQNDYIYVACRNNFTELNHFLSPFRIMGLGHCKRSQRGVTSNSRLYPISGCMVNPVCNMDIAPISNCYVYTGQKEECILSGQTVQFFETIYSEQVGIHFLWLRCSNFFC